jgi:hypothetical protein
MLLLPLLLLPLLLLPLLLLPLLLLLPTPAGSAGDCVGARVVMLVYAATRLDSCSSSRDSQSCVTDRPAGPGS